MYSWNVVWALRWRLWFYHLCVRLQPYLPLVPRRPEFSLMQESPAELPAMQPTSQPVGAT